jgi:hypothetical protein
MKLHKAIVPAVLVILGTVSIVLLQTQRAKPMDTSSKNQPSPLPLVDYLARLGEEYDFFFTVELASKVTESNSGISSHWIQRLPEKDVQRDLERLRQDITNFAYEVDRSNPRIIHVMDARLKQHKGYALESIIKDINFTGRVNDLPAEIGKQGIPIGPPLLMSFNEARDHTTVLELKGVGLKVRDALSHFVPLEKRRGRILWIASTGINQGDMSYVYYPYPGPQP